MLFLKFGSTIVNFLLVKMNLINNYLNSNLDSVLQIATPT